MKSRNFQELIRVADLLNSNVAIEKDKVDVNITETTTDGYLHLKAENTNTNFDEKFIKELASSGFKDMQINKIDETTTTFKILLFRD